MERSSVISPEPLHLDLKPSMGSWQLHNLTLAEQLRCRVYNEY